MKKLRSPTLQNHTWRTRGLMLMIYFGFLGLVCRLFYWQVIQAGSLTAEADQQYQRQIKQSGARGKIYSSQEYLMVGNQPVFRLYAHPKMIEANQDEVAQTLTKIILEDWSKYQTATGSAQADLANSLQAQILDRLHKDTNWVSLATNLSQETKQNIEALASPYLGFDEYLIRDYAEASQAAHLLGFVGKDTAGNDKGYFGLEGALDQELKPRSQEKTILTDAFGLEFFSNSGELELDGRDVITTIRRDVQNLIEIELAQGLEQYGATAGEVIVLEPKTGSILGLTALPSYEPSQFIEYPPETYKNPSLSNLYEPGSTFKVLTVASGIDAGVIKADTICIQCGGPRQYGKYTIKTWNDQYHPDSTITEGVVRSDNTVMIFVAESLGADKFQTYLKKFGIGQKLHLDLEEDEDTSFPTKWGPVELATTSFGQGITLNSLQLVRAISAIANGGKMMRPQIIKEVRDPISQEIITIEPQVESVPVSPQTARTMTEIMVKAAARGEELWGSGGGHAVAGKTGTAQVATQGGYDASATIATFIAFAPADDPQFIMFVKLINPTYSQWGAETAAPLWHKIAGKLYYLLEVPPTGASLETNQDPSE